MPRPGKRTAILAGSLIRVSDADHARLTAGPRPLAHDADEYLAAERKKSEARAKANPEAVAAFKAGQKLRRARGAAAATARKKAAEQRKAVATAEVTRYQVEVIKQAEALAVAEKEAAEAPATAARKKLIAERADE